jgi:hypothetical protein
MERHWWRVVAGFLLIVVGVVLTLAELNIIEMRPGLFGFGALLVGAAIFLSLWLSNPGEWWPLIPGLIMLSWAVSALLGSLRVADWVVSLVGFEGSALPFAYIYVRSRRQSWWALIPGGVLALMGVSTALGRLAGEQWMDVFVLLGIALAFVAVFFANRRNWWALIPAGVLTLLAVSVSPLGGYAQIVWAVLLIVAGLAFVLYGLLRRS